MLKPEIYKVGLLRFFDEAAGGTAGDRKNILQERIS
jgi:hypothetical protein